MMDDAPRRRWFRFSLRTFLVLVTLAGCVIGWLGWNVEIVRRRQAMLNLMRYRWSVTVSIDPERAVRLSWIRRMLGDESRHVDIQGHAMTKAELDELRAAFPEMGVPTTEREIESTRYPGARNPPAP